MDSIAYGRRVAVILLLVGGVTYGQSSLPAISPTSSPSAAAVPGVPAATAVQPPHAAKVSFSDGRLAVSADNSSLNQILREISRQTGMKITGGVNDERVYGSYGPSELAIVLTSLLDGTGSNMMLTASSAGGPGELILSPRQGGPTPPNPNAPGFDDDASTDEAVRPPPQAEPIAPPLARPPFAPPPLGAVRGGSVAPAISTPASMPEGTSATSSDGSVPQSPNGVKTPEQIYQQLQEMQRQQQTQPTHPQ